MVQLDRDSTRPGWPEANLVFFSSIIDDSGVGLTRLL
jgi:hypothetical protein